MGSYSKFAFAWLLAWLLFFPSPFASAVLRDACVLKTIPDSSECPLDQYGNKQEPCKSNCDAAKSPCEQAKKACETGAAGDEAATKAGEGATDAAQQGVKGPQDGAMGGAGGASCAGKDANKARQDAGAPVPPAMQKCQAAAAKCPTSKGSKAANEAGQGAQKSAGENAKRAAEGAQMGQMCDKDKQNESKMPQMPEMKMPEKKPGEGSPDGNPYESTIADKSAIDTNTDTTQKIDAVKFDNSAQANDVGISPVDQSVISGATPEGPSSGRVGGGGNIPFAGGSGGDITKGTGAATAKGLGSGASSLGGSSDGSKTKDGVAGADIKPESGKENFEVNTGGKSVLGLKSGKGDDDEISIDHLSGVPSKGGVSGDGKNGLLGQASGALQAGGAQGDSGMTIFTMVKARYRELRKIGEI